MTVEPGRAGSGRVAQCEKFPLVDDELARPSASLVISIRLEMHALEPFESDVKSLPFKMMIKMDDD